ncbi:MAG: leucyl aminopeptidase family protein [Lysobacterales bacterium]|jgi:leucyl aminopeptidase|nr:MAG: leucyl aminopeptidase family protein [Xanthomonadales bacterium]
MISAAPPGGQGKLVSHILPPASKVDVLRTAAVPSETTLARADAAAFVLPAAEPEKSLAALPHAQLWQALHRRARGSSKTPLLVSRLPNRRHTLAAVGFLRPEAAGFERLDLAGRLARELVPSGAAALQCHAPGFDDAAAAAVLEALASAALASAAPMPHRKSEPPAPPALRRIDLHGAGELDVGRCTAIAEGNHLARWLATLPPNELDSVSYRRALQALARREGWTFRFYDERALERLGAGAFLAVSRANAHRGAGIVRLGYRPAARRGLRRIGLVGKGICFDTGGINLKAQKGMYTMHGDMQGSAVAVGTLLAITRSRAPWAVDCWLALTENEIGPRAYRPQEIVQAMNGVTIQVVHSDAEGRMALADTLTLASRAKPDLLVDFATLTGACVNALTERYSGAFTNRPGLEPALQAVGRSSGERIWCFPMDEDFDADIESPVADVQQCSAESKGDHILAARFLSRFVEADVPWVHVDLSSAERKHGLAHVPTEFTGFGVRYAAHLLADDDFLDALGTAG